MRNRSFEKHYYLMLLPGMVWLVLFSLVPMAGIVMAFQDYNPGGGIWRSEWVGLDNFEYMFLLSDSKTILFNTVYIAVLKIAANLVVPLVFALMLNELRLAILKRWVQTIVYLPHFLSWVILSGIVLDVFALKEIGRAHV